MISTDISQLKRECLTVSENEFFFLKEQLKTALEKYNALNPNSGGIGLAAPQIGINKKACYISHRGLDLFLFNPVIEDAYDFNQMREGCLSVPGRQITIERFKHVFIKSSNYPNGIILSGMNATIAQHEIDHLNGILITDHLQTRVNDHKIKRNDPCHCGSGRKFKRCCINK